MHERCIIQKMLLGDTVPDRALMTVCGPSPSELTGMTRS